MATDLTTAAPVQHFIDRLPEFQVNLMRCTPSGNDTTSGKLTALLEEAAAGPL